MTDIRKWYSKWFSGKEELADEEEEALAELEVIVDGVRARVLAEVISLIDTHIRHLYPLTFVNSSTGNMERGKQLPTHISRLEPMDIEVLDQLEFVKAKLDSMKGTE